MVLVPIENECPYYYIGLYIIQWVQKKQSESVVLIKLFLRAMANTYIPTSSKISKNCMEINNRLNYPNWVHAKFTKLQYFFRELCSEDWKNKRCADELNEIRRQWLHKNSTIYKKNGVTAVSVVIPSALCK